MKTLLRNYKLINTPSIRCIFVALLFTVGLPSWAEEAQPVTKPWYLMVSANQYVPPIETCIAGTKKDKEQNEIPQSCFWTIDAYALKNAKAVSDNYYAVGYKNILYIKQKVLKENGVEEIKLRSISGEYSKLTEIQSISFDKEFTKIAVLNNSLEKQKILVYGINLNGNVSPSQVLYPNSLQGSTQIHFHPQKEELILFNPEKLKITAISDKGDSRTTRPKDAIVETAELSGANTQFDEMTEMKVTNQQIEVFDKKHNKTLKFDLMNEWGNRSPAAE
ncbi:MAG: hypothetical protein HOO06_11010 [Bdellovibrionaceae bacterium]|jgi:hypothetical protein|nr:hypothetical protein [Pseudobdellovibrionaceae bacterium]